MLTGEVNSQKCTWPWTKVGQGQLQDDDLANDIKFGEKEIQPGKSILCHI